MPGTPAPGNLAAAGPSSPCAHWCHPCPSILIKRASFSLRLELTPLRPTDHTPAAHDPQDSMQATETGEHVTDTEMREGHCLCSRNVPMPQPGTPPPPVTRSSVQSLNRVQPFVTPWTAARQASLSITNSRTCGRWSWPIGSCRAGEQPPPSSQLLSRAPPVRPEQAPCSLGTTSRPLSLAVPSCVAGLSALPGWAHPGASLVVQSGGHLAQHPALWLCPPGPMLRRRRISRWSSCLLALAPGPCSPLRPWFIAGMNSYRPRRPTWRRRRWLCWQSVP